jgi:hypothetical protein
MAKEVKKGIIEMLNGENVNVEEALKNANAMDQEVLEMAQNKMKEEEKKEKADQLIRMSKRAGWTNLRFLIEKRYTKECDEIESSLLKESKNLLDCLSKGEKDKKPFTPTMYEQELDKITDESIKKIAEAGKKRREAMKELDNSYVAYYCYGWGNPFQRINRAIEDNKRG